MKPMLAWCYHCERRVKWDRRRRMWIAATPMITYQDGRPTRLTATACPLSHDGVYHEPVPEKSDVARRESRRG